MSLRTPSTTSSGPSGQPGGPHTEPPYPWRLFVGMLLAIVVGGAIFAVALGLNPLTFQRSGAGVEATPVTAAPTVLAPTAPVATATPASNSTPAQAAVVTAQAGGAPAAVQTQAAVPTAQATTLPAVTPATTGATTAPTNAPAVEPTGTVTLRASRLRSRRPSP
jgi:hypothetical protein